MIKDKIINKPNKLFEFSNGQEAVDLLFELGLIDEFSTSHPPGKSTVQMTTGDLPTHHVIATRSARNFDAEKTAIGFFAYPRACTRQRKSTPTGRLSRGGSSPKAWRLKPQSRSSRHHRILPTELPHAVEVDRRNRSATAVNPACQ